jgi:hypothetical protein
MTTMAGDSDHNRRVLYVLLAIIASLVTASFLVGIKW